MSDDIDADYALITERAYAKYLRLKAWKSLNSTLRHDCSMASKEIEEMHKLHIMKLDIERQRALQEEKTRCTCPKCAHSTISQCTVVKCVCCLTLVIDETPQPYRGGWGLGVGLF